MSSTYRFGDSRSMRLAESLARAIDEHGAPNIFSPGELANLYPVRVPVLWRGWGMEKCDRRARASDYGRDWTRIVAHMRIHGYELTYSNRFFRVTKAPGEVPALPLLRGARPS